MWKPGWKPPFWMTDYSEAEQIALEGASSEAQENKMWEPGWKPSFEMTDYSDAEQTAVEGADPNCQVNSCDFHPRTNLRKVAGNKQRSRLNGQDPRCPACTKGITSEVRLAFPTLRFTIVY